MVTSCSASGRPSQASTSDTGQKATRIFQQAAEGRSVHLFVRYHTKTADGKVEPYLYCGTVQYERHQGSKPVRIWFQLDTPLPQRLWQVWNETT